MFGHIAKLQITARLASAGEGPYDRAQTAAVNKADLAQVQNDGAPVAQQPTYVSTQRLAFAPRHNSSVAVHDGDTSNLTSFKRQAQWSPMRLRSSRKIATLYPQEAGTGSAKIEGGTVGRTGTEVRPGDTLLV